MLFFYLNTGLTLFALMPVFKGCGCCRNNINTVICGYVITLSSTTGTTRDCFKMCNCKSIYNVVTIVQAATLHEEQTLCSVMILNAKKKVEILSKTELFCTSEDGLRNVVSFVKYNLTVNSLMLLKTRCVLYKNAYTPDDKNIKVIMWLKLQMSYYYGAWVREWGGFEGQQRPLVTSEWTTPLVYGNVRFLQPWMDYFTGLVGTDSGVQWVRGALSKSLFLKQLL